MTLLPTSFGTPRRGSDVPEAETQDTDTRAGVTFPVSSTSRKSESMQAGNRTLAGVNDLSRLSVSNDGRLYWDNKPVVVRRRLQLSFWQKLCAILIGFAALVIALSGAIHAAITAHDWMCSAKWVTSNCAAPPPPSAPPPPRPELPN